MKILVTGGLGFIGSQVVDRYVAAGHEVVVLDNLSTGKPHNLNPQATFYEVDIRDRAGVLALFEREQPEVLNHHAAQVDVRRSVADPVYDAEVNILGSLNLLEAARMHGTRKVIYISSGGACYGEPLYLPCDEAHPVNPLSGYGATKHTVEHYLFLYRENYGLDFTVLRYPNVYGPRQDPYGEGGVVAIFSHYMLHDRPVTIFGSGEQQRDFVFVGDCARANLLALDAGSGGIFNLGSASAISINELFGALRAITGYGRDPIYGPAKVGETFKIYLDASKAKAELGWTQEVSLEEGLRRTVAFFGDAPTGEGVQEP